MKGGVNLTEEDFDNGRIYLKEEQIPQLNEENMFHAALYCILSSAENYPNLKKLHGRLLHKKIDTSERIKNNPLGLHEIVKKARFPNVKEEHIYKFASWWPESGITEKIITDIGNGRQKEFEIRNKLAEEAPGIAYKCAALFLMKCGYENVPPIDLWMLRFINALGYAVKVPDYKIVSGLTKKEYFRYEKIFLDAAKKYNVSPALFQCTIWSKSSAWKKHVSTQLKLF